MLLKDQLLEDMKTAMRAKDTDQLSVVRMIRSEVKNFEIDNGEADDSAVQKIITTMVKQQKDALGDFEGAGREDLVAETKKKIEILSAYLPQQLSDSELEAKVKEVIDSASNKDFGPLMGQAMKAVAGQAEGGRVSAMLKKLLV